MRALNLVNVTAKTSMKKSWIYSAIKSGEFPAPDKIGRRSIWDEAEVDQWLARKFGANKAPAGKAVAP